MLVHGSADMDVRVLTGRLMSAPRPPAPLRACDAENVTLQRAGLRWNFGRVPDPRVRLPIASLRLRRHLAVDNCAAFISSFPPFALFTLFTPRPPPDHMSSPSPSWHAA